MNRLGSRVRRPVKRQSAERYLLLTLLSFAASVVGTRLFLELTGYPQIGNSELHIAHVLWGGLLLFFAALLPLILANRWVYAVGAVLGGVGVGLFIDEVGKFITQSNDYFYPLAAPIIYAFFLITVLLYLRVRRPARRSPRAELYRSLDTLMEIFDHDLDPDEHADLEQRLFYVARHAEHPDLARLAEQLLAFLASDTLYLAPETPGFLEQWQQRWRTFEARWLTQGRFKAILVIALLLLSLGAFIEGIGSALALASPETLEPLGIESALPTLIDSPTELNWFLVRLLLEAAISLLILVGSVLLATGQDDSGSGLAASGLLLSLTMLNLLVFYFDQFATMTATLFQFALWLGLEYYRQRYLQPPARRADKDQPAQEVPA